MFAAPSGLAQLRALREAIEKPEVYEITNYHWLLLYDRLEGFCESHNELARGADDGLWEIGPFRVGEIDFEELVDVFFWDTDFLLGGEAVSRMRSEGRWLLGLGEATANPEHGREPRAEDLEIRFADDVEAEP